MTSDGDVAADGPPAPPPGNTKSLHNTDGRQVAPTTKLPATT
jgi:hypothetical protein